jgi:Tfp pilus assembly protein FimT
MVELVVVVAIIGIMTAVAIPTFARMGLLWRNDLQASARELYTLLSAAKIYAGTYNVETAVVYTTYRPEGGASNNLRAVALMYQHPTLTLKAEDGYDYRVFIPVASRDEGQLRTLPGNTGLDLAAFPDDLLSLEKVKVLFTNSTTYEEWGHRPEEQGNYDALVFEPSGRLRKDGRELYTLHVCYTTDASPDERLVDPEQGEIQSNLRTIKINLYRATGRVEMASD